MHPDGGLEWTIFYSSYRQHLMLMKLTATYERIRETKAPALLRSADPFHHRRARVIFLKKQKVKENTSSRNARAQCQGTKSLPREGSWVRGHQCGAVESRKYNFSHKFARPSAQRRVGIPSGWSNG